MHRLLPVLATALVSVATAAAAQEPHTSPLSMSSPATGSDLPDMGSPAAAVLSQGDEYRLGAMVASRLACPRFIRLN